MEEESWRKNHGWAQPIIPSGPEIIPLSIFVVLFIFVYIGFRVQGLRFRVQGLGVSGRRGYIYIYICFRFCCLYSHPTP